MKEIDRLYLKFPFYGSRRMAKELNALGYEVNRKRIIRLMRLMTLEAMYPKPRKTLRQKDHQKYPYLLKNIDIAPQNHAWATDITYIPVEGGFIYLVAVLDLYSRYVLSWEISNTLESNFCIRALQKALQIGTPQIFNSDQGVQFTSNEFTKLLKERGISISMSGKGRCMDNIFVERFWRTLKYEEVFLKNYSSVIETIEGIATYIKLYNECRLHSSLDYQTPAKIYKAA
jgi:putative transposase